jgi:hypothetical protein
LRKTARLRILCHHEGYADQFIDTYGAGRTARLPRAFKEAPLRRRWPPPCAAIRYSWDGGFLHPYCGSSPFPSGARAQCQKPRARLKPGFRRAEQPQPPLALCLDERLESKGWSTPGLRQLWSATRMKKPCCWPVRTEKAGGRNLCVLKRPTPPPSARLQGLQDRYQPAQRARVTGSRRGAALYRPSWEWGRAAGAFQTVACTCYPNSCRL